MVNKLFMDLAKCAEYSGHGNVVEHRELVPLFATDKDGYQREIIADRSVDLNIEQVPDKINKIYDAFYAKDVKEFWEKRILAFEYRTGVDIYVLLSYLFMINSMDKDISRSLETATKASAIIIKEAGDVEKLKDDLSFQAYLKQSELQSAAKSENMKEQLEFLKR